MFNKFEFFYNRKKGSKFIVGAAANIASNLLKIHDKSNRQHRKIAVCDSTQLKNYSNYNENGKAWKESAKTFSELHDT